MCSALEVEKSYMIVTTPLPAHTAEDNYRKCIPNNKNCVFEKIFGSCNPGYRTD